MSATDDKEIALAAILLVRAAIHLENSDLPLTFTVEPEAIVKSESALADFLAAAFKPVRLVATTDKNVLRVSHLRVTEPSELEFLKRRSHDTRAYFRKRLRLPEDQIRVLLRAGRQRVVLRFAQFIRWQGEYSVPGTGWGGGPPATRDSEARKIGAHLVFDVDAHEGDIKVLRIKLPWLW